MLLAGIIINTLLFGYMGFTNEKTGIPHKLPILIYNPILDLIVTVSYPLSFLIILFAPGGFIRNVIIVILMQFIVNPILWGPITGIVAAESVKREMKRAIEKNKRKTS